MKDNNEIEYWDPYNVDIESFKRILKNNNDTFWGDHILIELLMNILDINIIILNSDKYNNKYTIYKIMKKYNKNKRTLILIYENENHFKLLGHFQNNMIVYFNNENIPNEIKKLI